MSFEIQLNLNERSKYVGVWFLVHSALIMQNMNFFNIKGKMMAKSTPFLKVPTHLMLLEFYIYTWNINI